MMLMASIGTGSACLGTSLAMFIIMLTALFGTHPANFFA
jgi:hypothetical protein